MDFLRKYFTGGLTPHEETQVQEWLVEHSDDPQVQDALMTIMSELEAEDMALSSAAFADVCKRLGLNRRSRLGSIVRKVSRWALGVAACLILPLLGAFLHSTFFSEQQVEWVENKVPHGQTEELMLADGTCLYLNAGSRITYPSNFTGDERKVFIEGEVYAEVASDPEHPFVISSGDVEVKVLGTTFNYKAYDSSECVELILLDGSVQMEISAKNRSRQLELQPGEMVQYDRKSGEIELKNVNPLQYKGFHENGAIHFFNLRLSDIVSDLERIFGTKVVLLDESLADTRYFAWFTNNETLEQILKGINADGKMSFASRNGVIYISRR